jgi:hypothetical protein
MQWLDKGSGIRNIMPGCASPKKKHITASQIQ